jgi:hypothetical protein
MVRWIDQNPHSAYREIGSEPNCVQGNLCLAGLCGRAGLPLDRHLHPHTLRHLAETSWLRNGMGLDQVGRLSDYTSPDTRLGVLVAGHR